jgi:hypothetical protein
MVAPSPLTSTWWRWQVLNSMIVLGALIGGLAAPHAAGQAPESRSTPSQAAVTVKPTVTLTGCLYREEQVPGRTPNIAESAGILEDYILADATMPDTQTGPGGGAAVGTSGVTPRRDPGTRSRTFATLV